MSRLYAYIIQYTITSNQGHFRHNESSAGYCNINVVVACQKLRLRNTESRAWLIWSELYEAI